MKILRRAHPEPLLPTPQQRAAQAAVPVTVTVSDSVARDGSAWQSVVLAWRLKVN
jgi:hypothetical protein